MNARFLIQHHWYFDEVAIVDAQTYEERFDEPLGDEHALLLIAKQPAVQIILPGTLDDLWFFGRNVMDIADLMRRGVTS